MVQQLFHFSANPGSSLSHSIMCLKLLAATHDTGCAVLICASLLLCQCMHHVLLCCHLVIYSSIKKKLSRKRTRECAGTESACSGKLEKEKGGKRTKRKSSYWRHDKQWRSRMISCLRASIIKCSLRFPL